jgi:RNA polymerase sigma-70 factor (ECF subfamily)
MQNRIGGHLGSLMSHADERADHAGPASPEERFLEYVRFGNKRIVQSLIQEFADRSYNQARRLIGREEGAEDAVQEAYLLLVSTANRYDGSVPFAAWLGRLVTSTAIDYRRRLRGHKNFSEMSDQGVAAMNDNANKPENVDETQIAMLRTAIDSLPERYRTPLNLHYLAGLDQSVHRNRHREARAGCAQLYRIEHLVRLVVRRQAPGVRVDQESRRIRPVFADARDSRNRQR